MGSGINGRGTGMQIGAGLLQAAGAVTQGDAQSNYYSAQADSVRNQARLSELAAERQIAYDTEEKAGRIELLRGETERLVGSQLAAMAASGMSLTSGSAADLVADSLRSGRRDIAAVSQTYADRAHETRLAAKLASIDAEAQAKQLKISGQSARRAGWISAGGSLLGTASQVAMQYRPKTPARTTGYDYDKDPLAKNIRSAANKWPWRQGGI